MRRRALLLLLLGLTMTLFVMQEPRGAHLLEAAAAVDSPAAPTERDSRPGSNSADSPVTPSASKSTPSSAPADSPTNESQPSSAPVDSPANESLPSSAPVHSPTASSTSESLPASGATSLEKDAPRSDQKDPTPRKEKARSGNADHWEIDLELEQPEEVVAAIEARMEELEAAWQSGNELMLAYGYALKGSGQYDKARRALKVCLERDGLLASYAALLLGEIELELKNLDEAQKWLEKAARDFPPGERQLEARFALARKLQADKQYEKASWALGQLLKDARRSPTRYAIRLKLAETLEQTGAVKGAIEHLEWLWSRVPATREATEAGQRLRALEAKKADGYDGPSVGVRYRRALRLRSSGLVEKGLTEMLELAADPSVQGSLPSRFPFQLAKSYFSAKKYEEAAKHLEELYPKTQGNARAEALFWRAKTQGRLAHFDKSIALYHQLVKSYPSSGLASSALFKIGLLHLDARQYKQAEEAFEVFRKRYPNADANSSAVWYVAWCQLRLGRNKAAVASFERLVRRYPDSSLVPGARYWQGRLARAEGDKDGAIGYFKKVLKSSLPSHYASLSEMWLEKLGAPRHESAESGPYESAPKLEPPNPTTLERTSSLLRIGLRTWAQEELTIYEHSLKSRSERLALAGWYHRTGNFGGARRLMARLGGGESVPKLSDRGLAHQLSFPRAYRDQLTDIRLPYSVSWELVYSIMRQESEFQPWVTSSAGARGLMQVIPETAEEVCSNRNLPSPALNEMYRPEVSVQYGIWHLEDLMKRFHGRLPLVIAAYNASPEAVERWLEEREVDPIDAFIEEISYSETRRYVRKVLGNLYVYRRLYADGKTPIQSEKGLDGPLEVRQAKEDDGKSAGPEDPKGKDVPSSDQAKAKKAEGPDDRPAESDADEANGPDDRPTDTKAKEANGRDDRPTDTKAKEANGPDDRPTDTKAKEANGRDDRPTDTKAKEANGRAVDQVDENSIDEEEKEGE